MSAQSIVLIITAVMFLIGTNFGLSYAMKKKWIKSNAWYLDIVNIFAIICTSLVLFIYGIFYNNSMELACLVALGGLGGFLFPRAIENKKKAILFALMMIVASVLVCENMVMNNLISISEKSMMNNGQNTLFNPQNILTILVGAIIWMGYICITCVLDRIPLYSFVTLSALFITGCCVTSSYIPIFSNQLNSIYSVGMLFLCLAFLGVYKKSILILGQVGCFFFSYLIGFLLFCIALIGKIEYVPVFIGYNLFEIMFGFGTTYFIYKKIWPIRTLMVTEKALVKNILPTKVVKKVFFITLMLSLLAALSMNYNQESSLFIAYICLVIIVCNSYNVFNSWGEPTPKLRNLFKDIKKGINEIKEQAKKK